ncbi:hypothetical protein T10_9186 [Trichinella papuae]|uniref:Uncharacterized protein n=1 Tax=Trichinella papuae TaxID=268474 RepID=A0A0V1M8T3_9BILA|nr:hypothetical protein T10_9186 [Trichinella papuae]
MKQCELSTKKQQPANTHTHTTIASSKKTNNRAATCQQQALVDKLVAVGVGVGCCFQFQKENHSSSSSLSGRMDVWTDGWMDELRKFLLPPSERVCRSSAIFLFACKFDGRTSRMTSLNFDFKPIFGTENRNTQIKVVMQTFPFDIATSSQPVGWVGRWCSAKFNLFAYAFQKSPPPPPTPPSNPRLSSALRFALGQI